MTREPETGAPARYAPSPRQQGALEASHCRSGRPPLRREKDARGQHPHRFTGLVVHFPLVIRTSRYGQGIGRLASLGSAAEELAQSVKLCGAERGSEILGRCDNVLETEVELVRLGVQLRRERGG